MDADRLVFALSLVLLAWWGAGSYVNRRRLAHLAAVVRRAIPALGRDARLRVLGSSAFRVDVGEPAPGLQAVSVVCLLEPRDFPLAWAWWRWRGLRDRVVVSAAFRRPPSPEELGTPEGATTRLGLEGLVQLELRPSPPHLRLAVALPPGTEERRLARALSAVARLAGEPSDPAAVPASGGGAGAERGT